MINPYSAYSIIDSSILTESAVKNIDMIGLCYDTVMEEAATSDVLKISDTYTESLISEILENVYHCLLKLYQSVLSTLNNYVLNSANVADKYREIIKERFKSLNKPFIYEAYEYPDCKGYPKVIQSDATLIANAQELAGMLEDKNFTRDLAAYETDTYIEKFSEEVIGETVDITCIKTSTRDIVLNRIRGRYSVTRLDASQIDKFLNEITNYKKDQKEIKATKAAVIKNYEALKQSYKKISGGKIKYMNKMLDYTNPAMLSIQNAEYNRYTNVNQEIIRLFNAYVTIYSEAFNTKLNTLKEKYENNTNIITELLVHSSVFTKTNVDSHGTLNKPIQYQNNIKL